MGEEGGWFALGEVGEAEGSGYDASGWHTSRGHWRTFWQLDVSFQEAHGEEMLCYPIFIFAMNDDLILLHDTRPVRREVLYMRVSGLQFDRQGTDSRIGYTYL